jgi:hypothetical protein
MYYALELIDRQTRNGKWYNLFIALFSGSGVLSLISEQFERVPFYASLIVLCGIVVNQIFSHLFYNADYCAKLCQLHINCYKYMHLLLDLHMKYHAGNMDDKAAEKQYRQICENYATIYTETSQLFGRINKKAQETAQKKGKKYMESIYYR